MTKKKTNTKQALASARRAIDATKKALDAERAVGDLTGSAISNLHALPTDKEEYGDAPAWSRAKVSRNFLRKNIKDLLVITGVP